MMDHVYSVTEFVALTNQILESAFPFVRIEGEVSNFKVSQSKWVTFRLSDGESILECFMTVWNMRVPIEDGMRVMVEGNPALKGKWGKFSVTAQRALPVGEGNLQRAFLLLKTKLEKEGLFETTRKRALPDYPMHVGLISSEQADGYRDFLTILASRWPLARVSFAHTAVQGVDAPEGLVQSLKSLNSLAHLPEVVVIVRGGGSTEDLASFNDEYLVRAIAESRVPVVVGVGHENDITLADLAADVRASTPSNAAEIVSADIHAVESELTHARQLLANVTRSAARYIHEAELNLKSNVHRLFERAAYFVSMHQRLLREINPQHQLERGYAIIKKDNTYIQSIKLLKSKDRVSITLADGTVQSEVVEG